MNATVILWIYIVLLAVGGLIGFFKAKSRVSLIMSLAFAAALGGLDTLVFAGGIGENAGDVRARVCSDLRFLGFELDKARNAANAPVISTASSRATVRVIRTDEELMIAREACRLLCAEGQDK